MTALNNAQVLAAVNGFSTVFAERGSTWIKNTAIKHTTRYSISVKRNRQQVFK